ncbi:MAG: hypothetical protein JWP88_510, partial [Flaviaesturariibacter sp.]|nr:hypothetical protein [Flaviaesturariibacter sp.]
MRKIYMLGVLVLTIFYSIAQAPKGTATIRVASESKTALEGSTVEVLRSKDSALVRTALTDKTGEAVVENLALGSYMARVSMVGYTTRYTEIFGISERSLAVTFPPVSLAPKDASQLATVTVAARKPFIQKLADRIVVNVENSIVSAGSSALDVLERSPGITIDQNDAISLRGRAGVIIMIDGKPSPMSGADLATYLRGLPSGAIERIDIITNPSAKYDASGNSGIIDIRMKKDQRLGTNGTLTAGYGQGVYPKANAGTTFNYRNKAVNLFGNYNYAYRENLNHLIINRNFYENGVFKGSDDKDNFARMPMSNHSARIGADFFISKNSIIGIVSSGNFLRFSRRAEINTMVNDINYHPAYRFQSIGTNKENRQNVVTNLNFKHSFGKTGKELSADVDYGIFNSAALSRTASSYYELNGASKGDDDILDGDQDGALRLRTGKVDYVSPLKKGARLEAGYKFSYVSSDNDAKFYNVLSSGTVVDAYKTNRFFYDEYNNAAYVNYSREFKKFNFQIGLRGEQTDLKTKQQKGGIRFKKDYFEPFPSAYFNYKLNEDKTIGISVSRRIDRPSYNTLNPFLFQVDATIYSTGDPHLKPQMTWSYEGSYTVKYLNFTLG